MFLKIIFYLLLVVDLTGITLAKKGGGGGIGRGGGSRTGSGGTRSGGSNIGRSNSQPSYPRSSSNVGGGGGWNQRHSSSGSSYGGGSWKTHAGAGVLGAVLGAAVAHKLTKSHYKYAYGNRDYYYGDRYYRPSYNYAKTCRYALPESEYRTYEEDGATVKEIIFECNGRTEYCCGMECCSSMPWWGIALLVLGVVALAACCIFAVMKFRRGRSPNQRTATQSEASVPLRSSDFDYSGGAKFQQAQGPGYYPQPYPAYYPAGGGNVGWQQPHPPPNYGFNVRP